LAKPAAAEISCVTNLYGRPIEVHRQDGRTHVWLSSEGWSRPERPSMPTRGSE
jgi:hypothetical protein